MDRKSQLSQPAPDPFPGDPSEAPRNRLAVWAMAASGTALGAMVLFILAGVAFIAYPRVLGPLNLALSAVVVLASITGVVLGVIAFFRGGVRSGKQRGRTMATGAVFTGLLLLFTCSIMASLISTL